MTERELRREYFIWMCQLVYNRRYSKGNYYEDLLSYLNSKPFEYTIDIDGNRAADGEDLRYRFGYERGYPNSMIAAYLDTRPCSILEMMVALAFRCEEHIMEDPDVGNRTGKWFWDMIESLGLRGMTNEDFDPWYVDKVLRKFATRNYDRNGKGGLFTIKNADKDMRTIDIWYQMCFYLDGIL